MRIYRPAIFVLMLLFVSCSVSHKLAQLKESLTSAKLALTRETAVPGLTVDAPHRDTLKVRDGEGREMLIMKAVRDENGEMVATEQLEAAKVVALFKNVAERHGKVDLRFNVIVPQSMTDSRWQIRLTPSLHINGGTSELDAIYITGEQYRRAQLRGYQQYERFLNSIVTDTTVFIRKHDLEIFIARNLPELYMFKSDTTYVNDEDFVSYFGVTEKELLKHYTDWIGIALNNRKKLIAPRKFRQFVKSPTIHEGLKLDTVIRGDGNNLVYEYVQTVKTSPDMRKALITMSGGIFEEGERIYTIPESDTLSFYISSLSSLTDNTERYLTKVIERRAEANSICWIEFAHGSADINPEIGNNASEISRIKSNIGQILEDTVFDLDSTVVTAYCSPEGTVSYNEALSRKRSESVCRYFGSYAKLCADSLTAIAGVRMTLDGRIVSTAPSSDVSFIPKPMGENWTTFSSLVTEDRNLTEAEKDEVLSLLDISDLDEREEMLSAMPYYRYFRESLYPHLRTVRFEFHMHRKGMVKDTVHTTVLDSVYLSGVMAIRNRDYEKAISILRPYNDFNTAIAYCSLDYNASAMSILKDLPRTPAVNYMLALLYSRSGDDQSAVQCYLDACREDEMYVHRGNLDPEISVLISRYSLNRD